jgi:hypothetical protein
MPVPPSQTRSCNAALALLGESARITSISDGTPLAKLFADTWDLALEEVIVAHPWNIALRRASLGVSMDFTPEGSQYSQAFELPADCARWLPWQEAHPEYFQGEQEGPYILSDAAAPIVVRYIALITDISLWSAGMRATLEAKLAMKLAKPITGQTAMIGNMRDIHDAALSEAKRQDGAATGDRKRTLDARSNWLDARNRRWSGR